MCSVCCQLEPAVADQVTDAVASVADHWAEDPFAAQEGQWVAAVAGRAQGIHGPVEDRNPCSYRSQAAAVRIPSHTQAPHRAAQESHARRRDLETERAAGTDLVEGLSIQIAAAAAADGIEVADPEMGVAAVAAAGAACGIARSRVAGIAS